MYKTFSRADSLQSHVLTHTGVKKHKGKSCEKTFSQAENQSHDNVNMGKKMYECRDYSKLCNTNSELNIHVRINTGEKRYKCKDCDRTFSQASNIKTHVVTHTGLKMHKCKVCDKSFF